ncbi:uncharacterized protein DNG_07982 [Cephalotrichum gorgonifer]|uniref:Uncharacterized protein n=1 Tax=Cephalotrichum gorgonifer TaxID=2041049 RepID=A0AAE8SXX9_9PEZI|nr:uncharacterized protein DNG_07982 [Cephalotrichum gorgonifer]
MSLRLVARNIGARGSAVPAVISARSVSTTSGENRDPKNGLPTGTKVPHDHWMASLASESEQVVKADRVAGKLTVEEMEKETTKVATEMKGSTASLTDGIWRSIGGGL